MLEAPKNLSPEQQEIFYLTQRVIELEVKLKDIEMTVVAVPEAFSGLSARLESLEERAQKVESEFAIELEEIQKALKEQKEYKDSIDTELPHRKSFWDIFKR